MKLFRKDLARAFCGWTFWVAVALGLGCLIRSLISHSRPDAVPIPSGTLNTFFYCALFEEDGYIRLAAPLMAALPFSMAYLDDVRSGYLKHELLRMKPISYAFQRAASTAVLGGTVFVASYLVFLLICFVADPAPSMRGISSQLFVFSRAYAYSMKGALALVILQYFAFGACYSLFSMGISALLPYKIAAFVIPLLFHQYIHILGWVFDIGEANLIFAYSPGNSFDLMQGNLPKVILSNIFVGVLGSGLFAAGFSRWRKGNWIV